MRHELLARVTDTSSRSSLRKIDSLESLFAELLIGRLDGLIKSKTRPQCVLRSHPVVCRDSRDCSERIDCLFSLWVACLQDKVASR